MTHPISKWWYLDLAADYPEIEMYSGGWKATQELALLELGDRVMHHEAAWLFTWIYTYQLDRIWAAVLYMMGQIRERLDYVPDGWQADIEAWERAFKEEKRN